MDGGWSAISQSELSGEEWTDCLAAIRPVGITVSGPFDSGIDRLWSASSLMVRSLIAKTRPSRVDEYIGLLALSAFVSAGEAYHHAYARFSA